MSDVSGVVVPPPVEPTLEKAWSRLKDVELSILSVADHVRGDMGENAPSLTTLDNRLGAVEAGLGTTQTSLSSLTGRVNEMDGWIRRVAFPFFQSQPGRDSAANTNTPQRRRSTDTLPWLRGSDMEKAIAAVLVAIGGIALVIFAIVGLDSLARTDGSIQSASTALVQAQAERDRLARENDELKKGFGGGLINRANAAPVAPPKAAREQTSRCKPGFTFRGGMCVGDYQPVDPDGPDPYRKVEDCPPGAKHQIKVPLPDGKKGYRLVDQKCRVHALQAAN